jgi:hypothetical protein|tara:strand:- start:1232 stop:1480 length:249 start_codon:yes stop_codon:yes gene_type:complete
MTEKQTKMIEELELEIENIVQDKTKNHFAISSLYVEVESKPNGECPILEKEIERLWFKQDVYNDRIKVAQEEIDAIKTSMKP